MIRRSPLLSLLSLALLSSLCISACDSKKEGDSPKADAPKIDDTTQPNTKDAPPAPVAKEEPPKIAPELKAALDLALTNCKMNRYNTAIDSCADDADKKLAEQLKTPDLRLASFDAFALALTESDAEKQNIAATLLNRYVNGLGKTPAAGSVSSATAKRLLDAWSKLPKEAAGRCASPVGEAAGIAGEIDAAIATFDGFADRPAARPGYVGLTRYARAKALPRIKKLAESSDPMDSKIAFEAALAIFDLTDAEKAEFCPWGESYLTHAEPLAFHGAARLMTRCGGKWIDALLARGEALVKEGKWTRDDVFVFRDICFTPIKAVIDEAGQEAQCERNYALLESAANDERLAEDVRGLSLYSIYYQRRDQKTYQVMVKYKNSKVEPIKKYANESIEALEKSGIKP